MIRVSRETFEDMVGAAVEALPEALRAKISNLAVVVDDVPRRGHLFGLYQGIPIPARGTQYGNVLPDLITIYQSTHEEACDSLEELREQVRITVRHEIAHHFGISDDRLEELGAY